MELLTQKQFRQLLKRTGPVLYVNKRTRELLEFSHSRTRTCPLQTHCKLRADAAVGLLADGAVVVGGGSDATGCFTTAAAIVSPTAAQILKLPLPIKGGTFLTHGRWIYCVGATIDSDEVLGTSAAPLMRFHQDTHDWQIFTPSYTDERVLPTPFRSCPARFEFSNLLQPGAWVMGDKIYLVGGRRKSTRGTYKPNKYVFSIDLAQDFLFKSEQVRVNLAMLNPLCAAVGNSVYIFGGYDLRRPTSRTQGLYRLTLSAEPFIERLSSLPFIPRDYTPLVVRDDYLFVCSCPFIGIYSVEQQVWRQFDFTQSRKASKSIVSHQTPTKHPEWTSGVLSISRRRRALKTSSRNSALLTEVLQASLQTTQQSPLATSVRKAQRATSLYRVSTTQSYFR